MQGDSHGIKATGPNPAMHLLAEEGEPVNFVLVSLIQISSTVSLLARDPESFHLRKVSFLLEPNRLPHAWPGEAPHAYHGPKPDRSAQCQLSQEVAMSLTTFLSAVLAGVMAGPPPDGLAPFQGTWTLVAMEREGEPVSPDDFRGGTATYEGNHVTLRSGDTVRRRGIVTVDPARKPAAINTWDLDGPYQDQTVPGIYKLEGDTLTLAFDRPGADRPEKFTTKEGTAVLLCVYKRQR
jgi:uncharacterized protein (TIGR03067 family)